MLAPLGLKVNELPGQIAPPEILIVGFELTVTFDVAAKVDSQPKALVPVTVYELVIVGVITALPPSIV